MTDCESCSYSFHSPVSSRQETLFVIKNIISFGLTLCLSLALIAQTNGATTPGKSIESQAAALSTASKLHEAAEAYERAAQAYLAEGNTSAAATASGKAAELYEKEADALLREVDAPPADKPAVAVPPAPAPVLPAVAHPRAVTPVSVTPIARPAPAKIFSHPPLTPRAGSIIGRVLDENGAVIPHVTVTYSGFEEGKLMVNNAENVGGAVQASGGTYAIRVPAGAYRVSAFATYVYQGRTYNFPMEPVNPPSRHDYDSLGLDELKRGLVRDFVLKMTAKRADAWEETETGYNNAYYGGRLYFNVGEGDRILGGGHMPAPPVGALPPESRLHVTLTPQGPRVDGTTGEPILVDVRLGDSGKYTFSQRGIYPGVYLATASLTMPTGEEIPLRVTTKPSRTILHGSPDGYDMVVMEWADSAKIDFIPSDLGPKPVMGMRAIELFIGK